MKNDAQEDDHRSGQHDVSDAGLIAKDLLGKPLLKANFLGMKDPVPQISDISTFPS